MVHRLPIVVNGAFEQADNQKLRLTIDGDETNKYVYWRSETKSSFQNKAISIVHNPWFKRYCISARIIPLRPTTQVRFS